MGKNKGQEKKTNTEEDQTNTNIWEDDQSKKKTRKELRKLAKIITYVMCAIVAELSTGWLGALFGTIKEPDNLQSVFKLASTTVFWVALALVIVSDGLQVWIGAMFIKIRTDLDKILDSKNKIMRYMDKLFEESELRSKELKIARKQYEWLEKREMAIREVM